MAKKKTTKRKSSPRGDSKCVAVEVLGSHVYRKVSSVDSYRDRYSCETCERCVTKRTRHSLYGRKRAPYRCLDFEHHGESTWRILEERIKRASRRNLLKLTESLNLPLTDFDHQQPDWILKLWLCNPTTKLFREHFFVKALVNDKSTPGVDIFRLYELATTRIEDVQEYVPLIKNIASGTATPNIILAGLRQEGFCDVYLASNPSIPKSWQQDYAVSPKTRVRRALASNPSLIFELAFGLARDSDTKVLVSLASNLNIPPQVTTRLSRHNNADVLRAVATHPKCHPSIVERINRKLDRLD